MACEDLREHISCLQQHDLIRTVTKEVDWDLEIGTIMSQVELASGPAVLFQHVKGSRLPLACSTMGSVDRYALGLGLSRDLPTLLNEMAERFRTPIDPVEVETGPCQETIGQADQIDLFALPTPRWHVGDGGRYLGTLGILITRDPETGQTNASIYRQQIVDRDKTCVLLGRDAGVMFRKYRELGQPMPVATCIGVDPAVLAATPMAFDYGQDELAMAGALRGKPVPVVKCKTVDLLVPATAEVVLEGYIDLDQSTWLEEGPFGEFTGHYAGEREKQPTIQLTAVTHRQDPILQGTYEDRPPNESDLLTGVGRALALRESLIRAGVPGIKDVWSRGLGFIAVISLERTYYAGHARQVIDAALATTRFKYFIVVDADIDVFDSEAVDWALATRVQPHRDIVVTDPWRRGSNLDPSIPPEIRPYPINRTSKIGVDATTGFKGFDWPTPIRQDEAMLKRVLKQWEEYGLGIPAPAQSQLA